MNFFQGSLECGGAEILTDGMCGLCKATVPVKGRNIFVCHKNNFYGIADVDILLKKGPESGTEVSGVVDLNGHL